MSILRATEEADPRAEGEKSKETFHLLPATHRIIRSAWSEPEQWMRFLQWSFTYSFNKHKISTFYKSGILVYPGDIKTGTDLPGETFLPSPPTLHWPNCGFCQQGREEGGGWGGTRRLGEEQGRINSEVETNCRCELCDLGESNPVKRFFCTCDLVLLFSHFHIMPYFLICLLFNISYF